MEKKNKDKNSNDFYQDLDKNTRFQGNCSCLGLFLILIAVSVILFFFFSYFYLNK